MSDLQKSPKRNFKRRSVPSAPKRSKALHSEYWEVRGQRVFVQRKKIKNLYLRIREEEGIISISAPLQMPEMKIRAFLLERWDWIHQKQEQLKKQGPSMVDFGKVQDGQKLKDEYQRRLKEQVPILLDKWELVMGVSAKEWRLRDMKTRWGSCNVEKRRIWLNVQLAGKPLECLEYVVVHELCHLLEASHNKVFWGYMTYFLPDWKERRALLNKGKAF